MSERAQLRLLLGPFLAGAALLVALPAAATFIVAFTEYDGIADPSFTGLDNFRDMPGDAFLRDALRATLIFVALAVPLRLVAATGLALLLHRRFRGVGAARTAAFLPTMIPEGAYALLWAFLLNPVYGPANALLGGLGLPQPDWTGTASGAMALYVVMSAFTIGEGFVVALAARQELPDELYAAAAMEGASPWFVLRRVTLPLMSPTLLLLACRDLTLALSATFAAVYLITDGGPDRATLFLPVLVYDYSFEQLRYGYAAAISLVLFAFTAAAVLLAHRVLRKRTFGLLG
jgi:multiple sugar transport system permease protein